MRILQRTALTACISMIGLMALPSGVNATYYSDAETRAAAQELAATRATIRANKAEAKDRATANIGNSKKHAAIGLLILAAQKDCSGTCSFELRT